MSEYAAVISLDIEPSQGVDLFGLDSELCIAGPGRSGTGQLFLRGCSYGCGTLAGHSWPGGRAVKIAQEIVREISVMFEIFSNGGESAAEGRGCRSGRRRVRNIQWTQDSIQFNRWP